MGRPAGRSEESNHSHPWAQCTGHFRMREVPQPPGCWCVRAKEGYGRSVRTEKMPTGNFHPEHCVTHVPVFLHVIVTMSSAEYAESQPRVLKEN